MARGINVLLTLKDRFTRPLQNVAESTKTAQRQFKQANNTISRFGEGFKSQVGGLVSSIGILGGALGVMSLGAFAFDAINTYKDFDQAMHNVAATAGITASRTNEDYKRMEDAARQMGAKTSKTAAEAANALNYMSLAGWSVDDSLKGLEPVLRLAEASGMDLAQCSDAVTDSLSALSLTADDMPRYLDVACRAQQKSNQTASMLMEAYKSCGGVMKGLNVPLEESATALGVLANRGIKSAEAGNSLSSLMVNLTTGTGAAGKKLEEIGVSAFDSQGKFIGLQNTLLKLNEATKNMSEEERNATMAAIGGKEQIKTLNALMAGLTTTTKDGRTEWNALSDELTNNADGSLMNMAKTMNDTLPGAISRFRSAIEDAQLSFMDAFGPTMKNVLDDLAANLLPALSNELAYFGKDILPIIVDQMGIIVPLFAGIASGFVAFSVIGKVSAMMSAFGAVIKGVSTVTGVLNIVMAMNPIALWAIGIGIVVAGLIVLWNKCEGFRNLVKNIGAVFLEFGQSIAAFMIPIVQGIGEKFNEIATKINTLFEALTPIAEWLGNVLAPMFGFIGGLTLVWLEGMFTAIGRFAEGLFTIFGGVIEFLTGVFTGNWSMIWEGIKEIFSGIIDAITGIFTGFISGVSSGLSRLIDKAKSLAGFGGNNDNPNSPDNQAKSVPRHATGTPYFGGGLTSINESGGEVVNLPSGTQIIPHDVSKKIVNNNSGAPITIELHVHGNVIGNAEFLNECGEHIFNKVKAAMDNM